MKWAWRAGSALLDMGSPLSPAATEGLGGVTTVGIDGYSVLETLTHSGFVSRFWP
jgi:hypothetical protein